MVVIVVIAQAYRKRWNVKALIILVGVTAALEVARQVCVANQINIADYRLVIYALMLILMMILRPDGLFGVKEIWDVFRGWKKPPRLGGKKGETA